MISDNSWERARQTLSETLGLDERRIVWLAEVRGELQSLASAGISTAPDFTLHNEVHSDNLVLLLGDLSTRLTSKLSDYESYLLVAAAYLHDIGMFVGAGRFNATMLPDMAGSLKVCPCDQCDGGSQYQASMQGKSVDQQIRVVHHLVSARMIDEDGAAQFHLPKDDLPHIITVCRGHRKADLTGRECDCYKTVPTKFGPVRRDLLASLLRLADALDFYPDRAPERVFRERAWDFLSNPVALKHWLHHYFVRSVYITPNDQGGNRSLDCQISYAVPVNRRLNGQPYIDFMRPLLDQYLDEVQQGDFNTTKYPSIIFESLGVRDLHIEFSIKPELGVGGLPERIIDEIELSGCDNASAFIHYLESKSSRAAQPDTATMDRRPEVKTFRTMLDGDDPQHRLLLMVGQHGQGKTWLMKTFEKMCLEQQLPYYRADLSTIKEVEEILDGIWQRVGPHHFPNYSALRERTVQVDPRPLADRQRELTQCFFGDWEIVEGGLRIVLLLDTYEHAAPTIKDWLESLFLEGIKSIGHAIVVIGGREWPSTSIYWSDHSYRFPLEGVQLRDYREYATQRGVPISEDELVQLHQKWSGLPKLFDEYLNYKLLA